MSTQTDWLGRSVVAEERVRQLETENAALREELRRLLAERSKSEDACEENATPSSR